MKAEVNQKCPSEYDGNKCVKPAGHRGKHLNDEDKFVMWTTAGAAQATKQK